MHYARSWRFTALTNAMHVQVSETLLPGRRLQPWTACNKGRDLTLVFYRYHTTASIDTKFITRIDGAYLCLHIVRITSVNGRYMIDLL